MNVLKPAQEGQSSCHGSAWHLRSLSKQAAQSSPDSLDLPSIGLGRRSTDWKRYCQSSLETQPSVVKQGQGTCHKHRPCGKGNDEDTGWSRLCSDSGPLPGRCGQSPYPGVARVSWLRSSGKKSLFIFLPGPWPCHSICPPGPIWMDMGEYTTLGGCETPGCCLPMEDGGPKACLKSRTVKTLF